jgi:UDPglucose--hexose-1-phosphate uridylyltransferase
MIDVDIAREASVIVTPSRRERPHDTHGTATHRCPFCPGNESDTEPAVWTDADPWTIRAVPNRYPVVDPENGRHEVVVDSPKHTAPWAARTPAEIERVLRAAAAAEERVAAHPRARTSVVWKNAGPTAGASLRHPHLQALSLPYVAQTWKELGERVHATLAESERERDVASNAHVAVVVPRFPRATYEVQIVPRMRVDHLAAWDDATFAATADAVVALFRRLTTIYGDDFDHNVLLHPQCVAIVPRGRMVSGLQLAIGVMELDRTPAEAARALRLEKTLVRA